MGTACGRLPYPASATVRCCGSGGRCNGYVALRTIWTGCGLDRRVRIACEYGRLQGVVRLLPLHNARPGTKYPATLLVTGDHDTRVSPMHSFKLAATLQAAQAGRAPILLYLEASSGHGGGTTLSQATSQLADIYSFLAENLEMRTP